MQSGGHANYSSDDETGAPSAKRRIYGFKPKNVLNPAPPKSEIRKAMDRARKDDTSDEEEDHERRERAVNGLLPAKDVFLAHGPERFLHRSDSVRSNVAQARLNRLREQEPEARWFDGSELFCNRLDDEPMDLSRPYVGLDEIVGEDRTRWKAIFISAMVVDAKFVSVGWLERDMFGILVSDLCPPCLFRVNFDTFQHPSADPSASSFVLSKQTPTHSLSL